MMSWVRALMAALLSDTPKVISTDITANNNLNLTAKTLANIANQQTTTQKRDTTTTIGKAAIYLNFFILIPNNVLGESFDGCFAKRYTKGDFNALLPSSKPHNTYSPDPILDS
jgi:hypothetical protein